MTNNPKVAHRLEWIDQQRKTAVKQLHDFIDTHKENIIVLDTETTGLNYDTDQIIQIGIVDYSGITLMNRYLTPTCRIHPKALQVHGLTLEILAEKGAVSFKEAYQEIFDLLFNKVVIGYNLNYDSFLLTRQCLDHNLPMPVPERWVDMMGDFSKIIGVWDTSKHDFLWQKLSKFVKGSLEETHDAVFDCNIILKQLYKIDNYRR
jgi:DNA polymerase III epsilon subunit-like protein